MDGSQVSPMPGGCGNCVVGMASGRYPPSDFARWTTPWMPSEPPKLGMPRRLTEVSVERKSIFSSVVMRERMFAMRWAAGRSVLRKGYCCCAEMDARDATVKARRVREIASGFFCMMAFGSPGFFSRAGAFGCGWKGCWREVAMLSLIGLLIRLNGEVSMIRCRSIQARWLGWMARGTRCFLFANWNRGCPLLPGEGNDRVSRRYGIISVVSGFAFIH